MLIWFAVPRLMSCWSCSAEGLSPRTDPGFWSQYRRTQHLLHASWHKQGGLNISHPGSGVFDRSDHITESPFITTVPNLGPLTTVPNLGPLITVLNLGPLTSPESGPSDSPESGPSDHSPEFGPSDHSPESGPSDHSPESGLSSLAVWLIECPFAGARNSPTACVHVNGFLLCIVTSGARDWNANKGAYQRWDRAFIHALVQCWGGVQGINIKAAKLKDERGYHMWQQQARHGTKLIWATLLVQLHGLKRFLDVLFLAASSPFLRPGLCEFEQAIVENFPLTWTLFSIVKQPKMLMGRIVCG